MPHRHGNCLAQGHGSRRVPGLLVSALGPGESCYSYEDPHVRRLMSFRMCMGTLKITFLAIQ